MLVSTHELVNDARRHRCALGAFNTYNLEITNAVLRAAEAQPPPSFFNSVRGNSNMVALSHSSVYVWEQLARRKCRWHCISITRRSWRMSDVRLRRAFHPSCSGSRLDFAANIAATKRAAEMAHAEHKLIEAELGRLAGSEDVAKTVKPNGTQTDSMQAAEFVQATGIDLLVVCIGNVHGFYSGAPNLDFARLDEIQKRVSVLLVMHGTSRLPDETIRALMAPVIAALTKLIVSKLLLFGSAGKAH